MTLWLTPLLLIALLLLCATGQRLLRARYPGDTSALVEAIDLLLPQTQCAQCGYAGCRPYAQAIVEGEALNLCPPGGSALYRSLSDLMGHEQTAVLPEQPANVVAVIDESQCIGCALCLPPCPVDAIVGAANKMHTVLEDQCTGCELCVPACPVDCITLEPRMAPTIPARRSRREAPQPARACINCSLCNPVCPVDLPAQELLQAMATNQLDVAAAQGLTQCIECGLCDRACPSNIAMAEIFGAGKQTLETSQAAAAERQQHKSRYEAHLARQAAAAAQAADKRAQRLQNAGRWS